MIITDDQFVKIGGILLPGVFKSLEVTGAALVEELEVEGKGKKPKQATGYEDGKISIDIILMDDDKKNRYEKLEKIQNIFRKKGQQKPQVYEVINKHATKRGISKVIFKELSTKETNKRDEITVSLLFIEYEQIKVTSSKSSTSSSSGSSSSNKSNASSSATVGSDYQNYLNNNRGSAPKISDKTSSTPAKDINAPKAEVK